MESVVKHGKPGTAMMSFSKKLSDKEIGAVVYFVRIAFMDKKMPNTKYHTIENGWLNMDRYKAAFPFVLGKINLDTAWESLTPNQKKGKQLYLDSCISCHDRGKVKKRGAIWESFPLSWPRNGVTPKNLFSVDSISGASPYAVHNKSKPLALNKQQQRGEQIFKKNCAFCHAQDGTGKNWIGQFIQPHPRNFTASKLSKSFTKSSLSERITNGVEGSAMPAWKYVLNQTEINDLVDYLWLRFN